MEADERPTKIRKLSHERITESDPTPTKDVSMQDSEDAGAKTNDPSPTADLSLAANNEADDGESAVKLNTSASATTTETVQSEQTPALSKNALKKLRRQQEWDAKKQDRKVWRKEKNQQKRERKREARVQAAESGDPDALMPKQRNYVRATQLPITFVFDCDFDDKMRDNERISLAGQITRCYSDNKNAPFRAHLAVCSFNGKLRERFDTVLAKHYHNWKGTQFLDEDFVVAAEKAKEWMAEDKTGGKLASVFAKYLPENQPTTEGKEQQPTIAENTEEQQPSTHNGNEQPPTTSGEENSLTKTSKPARPTKTPDLEDPETKAALIAQGETIYLSSDSDYTLTELKPYSTYIIGGLVDKNREKGICHARALAKGIKTARLPIGDYLTMASRKVLATNHVNEIMLRWLECGDWGEAFMKVIPKRKGGQLKGGQEDEGDNYEEGEYGDEEDQEELEAEEENRQEAETVAAEKKTAEEPTV